MKKTNRASAIPTDATAGGSAKLLAKINALANSGRFHEALVMVERAADHDLGNAELLNMAGACAAYTDELSKAEYYWRRALELKADFPTVYNNLGVVLERQNRYEEAENSFRQALVLLPSYAEAYSNLGDLLEKQQRYAEAEASYRKALFHQPNLVDVHRNLANLLTSLKRYVEAEQSYRQAIALNKNVYAAHLGLGNVLFEMKCYAEAEAGYRKALILKPNAPDAHHNLAVLLYNTQRCVEAESEFRKAVRLNPDYAEAQYNLGMLLNFLGRFSEGWKLFEYRYHWAAKYQPALPCFSFPFPQWQGQNLQGKSIVVCPEQGYGDQIQFCRYCAELKNMGASHITLLTQAPLTSLFETLAAVDTVLVLKDVSKLKTHDYWTLLLSVPLHCGTELATIPAALPYLSPDKRRLAKWSKRMPKSGLRVGLVWKGNPEHINDANRSLSSLQSLAPVWQIPELVFIRLQIGQAETTAVASPQSLAILELGAQIEDFADTAAIISQLDLLICVDTAVAHLAGALQKPCWVLLPSFKLDWRWMQGRDDSPWYPGTMRLFRQGPDENWAGVVNEVHCALQDWCLQRQALKQTSVPKQPASPKLLLKLQNWLQGNS